MMRGGVAAGTIAAWVQRQKIEPPLSSDDRIAWGKTGIPDEVIRAAVAQL